MSLVSGLQNIKTSTWLLWLGWLSMLIGLFIPVINIPVPDLHLAPMLFFGLPIPKVDETGSVEVLTHVPIEGLRVFYFLFFAALKKGALTLPWLLLYALYLPLVLALIAPVMLWARSKMVNIILAICTGAGFLGPGMMLMFSAKEAIIGLGFYCWVAALLLLTISRINACFNTPIAESHDRVP